MARLQTRCPYCGSSHIAPSRSFRFRDVFFRALGFHPHQCICGERFHVSRFFPNRHPTKDTLEARVMRTLPDAEIKPLERHLATCLLCRYRLAETVEYMIATRAAAVQCSHPEAPMHAQPHRFIHDTDDGLIVSEVNRLGPEKWFAHHWGLLLDGGITTKTPGEAMAYLTESFQQMFPDHVCTVRCRLKDRPPQGNSVPAPADSGDWIRRNR